MDPTEVVKNLRANWAQILEIIDSMTDRQLQRMSPLECLADDMAVQWQAIDQWLARGGHLPAQWDEV